MSLINLTGGIGIGAPGKDAYQTWLDEGNVGTEAQFLTAIGAGQSAYDIWIAEGNVGTQADFLNSLTGNGTPVEVVSDFPVSPVAGTLYIKLA